MASAKDKWHRRFLSLVHNEISKWSKDTSTKVGAVIIGPAPRRLPLSFGYNGIPRGVNDGNLMTTPERHTRPSKYFYWEHAERNAIYNAQVSLVGATMYVTHYPCADCARAIIQNGIAAVVTYEDCTLDTFADSQAAAAIMFSEAGVDVIHIQQVTESEPSTHTGRVTAVEAYEGPTGVNCATVTLMLDDHDG